MGSSFNNYYNNTVGKLSRSFMLKFKETDLALLCCFSKLKLFISEQFHMSKFDFPSITKYDWVNIYQQHGYNNVKMLTFDHSSTVCLSFGAQPVSAKSVSISNAG